eukprot:TRINITY_DN79778_c0_g1_i1.p1 TRINITY_DN79778_c0_g1~~TRINITY_DN79778_c0_g1_i1.p1  ORF type:complete len:192 (+),score=29.40 TRINITY_DN79778_c0_g1_i1:126-701(+)
MSSSVLKGITEASQEEVNEAVKTLEPEDLKKLMSALGKLADSPRGKDGPEASHEVEVHVVNLGGDDIARFAAADKHTILDIKVRLRAECGVKAKTFDLVSLDMHDTLGDAVSLGQLGNPVNLQLITQAEPKPYDPSIHTKYGPEWQAAQQKWLKDNPPGSAGARYSCSNCGYPYHTEFKPMSENGKCSGCS